MAMWIAAMMIVAAVAMFVAAPLTEGFLRRRASSDLDIRRLEHDRSLAVQGLRELEFDHEMGKLDEADYQNLRSTLEGRALAAMSALEAARSHNRTALRLASRRAKPAMPTGSGRNFNFCPQCGVRVGVGHRFCGQCGAQLLVEARAANQAE